MTIRDRTEQSTINADAMATGSVGRPRADSAGVVSPQPPPWILWLVALLPFALLAIRQWSFPYGIDAGDYAHYLLHAAALAHLKSYSNIGYIYTTYNPLIGPPAQPPGLPLTLAPIIAVAGANMTLIRLVIVASAVLFIVLSGRYFARQYDLWIGAGVALLLGVSLESQYATSNVLSDLGFCALVWALISVADGARNWSWSRVAAVTLLGLAAMSYRTAGVALVPALILFAILARERRALVPVALWTTLGMIVAVVLGSGAAVASLFRLSLATIVHTVTSNFFSYRYGFFDAVLYPTPWRQLNVVYHAFALALLGIGLATAGRRFARTFLASFVIAYTALLLLAPVREARYAWPLLPVFAFLLLLGLWRVCQWAASSDVTARRIPFAIALALSLGAILTDWQRPTPQSLPDMPAVRQLFGEIRDLAKREHVRVVFVNPRVLTWETGVPAMGTFNAPPDKTLREIESKRITHVVVGDLGLAPAYDSSLRRTIANAPNRFSLVFQDSAFAMYHLLAPK